MTDNNDELTRKKQAVNAYQKAIALQYEGVGAPVVTATGEGVIAEDIIALARELGIPLYENPELTEMLAMLELGDEIPHELYIIIAQIIALAYNIKGIIPDSMDHFPRS
ncbi:MAG: flagellar biosynthesis protein FlhB [Cellvibrionales bacterium]|jgi:flagellar biosynthesis protein|nr:flagellar biosynthesis protein FlhB [Cellvibrionales bacterium]MBT6580008.1 flagellar biosynthesis protein FlhB [Cellvibrionales bacterium]